MPEPRKLLPFPKDRGLEQWRGDLTKSRHLRKTVQSWWDKNVKSYAPDMTDDPEAYGTKLNTNRDFTLVERKKADLFYQRPDVTAIPSPLFEGQGHLLTTHTQILNEKLGLDGVNAKQLVHQVLFDVLCPSGTGWTVMGYESTTVDQQTVDPMTGQPTTVPVPIFEDCYWRWISPKQGLIPHDFRSTLWDDAPWLGYEFEMPVRLAKRKGWVKDDFLGSPPNPELHFDHGFSQTAGDAVVHGCVIWYKSALYRDDRVHPKHLTLLILIEGVDQPAEHKDSPYQTLDPQGRLTPDSLIGFPVAPLTIRWLSDAAHVPSDCTISRPLVNELNLFREQMVQFRDAAILRWMYNVDTLPLEALGKIVRSPVGGFIGVPGEAFVGEGAIKELPHGSYPRENFSIADYIDHDLSRTHALDEAQQGVSSGGDTTATEAQIQQSNVNARLGLERGVVLDWYLRGVTKYSTLIQRFVPVEQAATIVGPEKAQEWDSWRKNVPASLAFTALPDSSLRHDLPFEQKRRMDNYTYWANDPWINRQELLKETMPYMGYSSKVVNAEPPATKPEPPKLTLTIKAEDLNPLVPQYPNVYQVLTQQGVTDLVQPVAQAVLNQPMPEGPADTKHGGKMAQMESLDKHQVDETGGMQGTGQPAAMGSGVQ